MERGGAGTRQRRWSLDEHSTEFKVGYPYFSKEAIRDESRGTYAEKAAKLAHNVTYSWNHTRRE